MRTRIARGWLVRGALAFAVVSLAAGATSFVLFPVFSGARDSRPVLQILEPGAWASEGAAAIEVGAGRSVAISGIARHTAPIVDVRLNGRRLATTVSGDPSVVEFSGFFDAADLRPDGTIAVEARGLGDARTLRLFPVTVDPRPGPGPGFAEVERGGRGQRWAVIIGAGAHADPRLHPRAGAAEDARRVAEFLASPAAGLGGFAASHMRVLVNEEATGRNIRSALKTFLRTATPGDLVVIYLAGRAVPDPGRPAHTYVLAYDSDADDLPATAVNVRFLIDAVEEVYGHTRVVVADLDADAITRSRLSTRLLERTTARQGGLAVLVPEPGEPLTDRLLAGLRGPADTDDDGIVRLGELLGYAGGRVSETSYDRSWPLAVVPPAVTAAVPARAPAAGR